MLDRKFILANIDAVKQNCQDRGVNCEVDKIVEMDESRKELDARVQDLNRQANETAKKIGGTKDPEQRQAIIEQGRQLREQKDHAQKELDELEHQIIEIQRTIPNMAHPDAPRGEDDQANLEISRGQHEPREFDFTPKDHLDLGTEKGWIDFEGGARTTGQGFYFIKGDLVLVDLALQQLALSQLMKRGFTPAITPDLAKAEVLEGIGFMPRGPETQVYSVENSDFYRGKS